MKQLHMGHIAKTAIQSQHKRPEDVADAIGITRQSLYHNLRSRTVKAERLEEIADCIGITTSKMFEMWIVSTRG
ncbi:hypothetical protein VP236O401_P0040 [Vibrio phage 236O40-1]|nr:hypothetical protein VP236O401_P0040 [Vibrio phage 236O40-1]